MTRTARITLSPDPAKCSVEIDGRPISHVVRGLSIGYRVHDVTPHLELDLVTERLVVEGEMAVHIDPAAVDALIALGWSPPATDPEAMREAASRLLTAANEAEASR